jgi:hypothetical protein
MSEQEQHTTPEDMSQPDERTVDVLSLKKVDMTVADYARYSELDPDDPEVSELLDQYNITPGESIIVSATDLEDSNNNFNRVVVAGGEDSFTTHRLLTSQLEEDLGELIATEQPSEAEQAERTVEAKTGLTMTLVEDLASRLANDAQLSRESSGRHRGIDTVTEANALVEAYEGGRVSDKDLSVIAGALLGSSSNRSDIEAVFSEVKSAGVLAESDIAALSTQWSSLENMGRATGPNGDQMKIGYINSLIGRSESLLTANNRKPTAQYRVIVGMVMGLSAQIKNQAASSISMSGALNRMRKMDETE